MKLTQERLKEILHYDPDTGIFTWKVKKAQSIKVGSIANSKDVEGYIRVTIDRKSFKTHRLAFLYMEGFLPENCVDHIDHNRFNNKWSNLREVSTSCNTRNRNIQTVKSNTGIRGVSKRKRNDRSFEVYIGNGKGRHSIHVGTFTTLERAVRARWEAEKKYNYPTCNSTSSAYLWLKERGLIEEVKCNVKHNRDKRIPESRQLCFNF